MQELLKLVEEPGRQILRDLGGAALRQVELLLERQQVMPVIAHEPGARLLVIPGKGPDELPELVDDRRQDQRDNEREDQRHHRDDGERGRSPAQADAAQAVHDGIEQVGEHEAGHERQEDVGEHEQPHKRPAQEQHPERRVGR